MYPNGTHVYINNGHLNSGRWQDQENQLGETRSETTTRSGRNDGLVSHAFSEMCTFS